MRIAIAGFQHETNTFVKKPTELIDFKRADSWPELLEGEDVIKRTLGMNLPIAGFAHAAEAAGTAKLEPILWCAAEPGGAVSDEAYDEISGRILRSLKRMGHVDAIYLDLHGAMVTQTHDDAEGHLLQSIRNVIGPNVVLVASLDLHANVTADMVDVANALTIFRTYPHLDMAATGARAYEMLVSWARDGAFEKAWRQGEYLIPLFAQHTGADPGRRLYDTLAGCTAEIAMGFTAADIPDAGPSVLAYARTQAAADQKADALLAELAVAEPAFDCTLMSPSAAVAKAIDKSAHGTVVIADVQDNPGAGASSDTTGLLRELIRQNVPRTLLGLMHDPDLASQAHAAGEGSVIKARIGGRGPGDTPLRAKVRVDRLSEGRCVYSGEMYGGGTANLGRAAALTVYGTDITVVVTSVRNQCLDLAHFRHFNLKTETARIVCVKSTAHFRADFDPIASETVLCAATGQFPCQLEHVNYAKLRPGVRLGPMGRIHGCARKGAGANSETLLEG